MQHEEQSIHQEVIVLSPNHSIGQTLVTSFDGLTGIRLYLEQVPDSTGELELHLRESVDSSETIAQANLPLEKVRKKSTFYAFDFPAIPDSSRKDYYLILRIKGTGSVGVGVGPADSYIDGSLYQDGTPRSDGQLSFNMVYDSRYLIPGIGGEIIHWVFYLAVGFFLFFLPGAAILVAIQYRLKTSNAWIWSILATGIGIAIYPVLLYLTDLVGLRLSWGYAWFPPLFSLVFLLWKSRGGPRIRERLIHFVESLSWYSLSLGVIVLVIFGIRFWMIRDLEAPLWGDSLQHTMMAQLILDHGGLFESWQPYIPYESLTIHFGFPVLTALFSWLTGVAAPQATLWMGQLINGFAALALYPLAMRLTKGKRWVGSAAVLVAGLLCPTPAVYLNWGRYAQLTGQALLPVAIWLLWDVLETPEQSSNSTSSLRVSWSRIFLAGVVLLGMTFCYYRTPILYAGFFFVLLFSWFLPRWKGDNEKWGSLGLGAVFAALTGIILAIPWGVRLLGSRLAWVLETSVTQSSSMERLLDDLKVWRHLLTYVPLYLLILAGVAVVIALIRKKWAVAALPLWFLLLIAYMFGNLIQLPGSNMLQSFSILIALYLPISLLAGWIIGMLIHWILRAKLRLVSPAIGILLIYIAVRFGWQQRLLLDENMYTLVSRPDQIAMAWIDKNTPPDAVFLVQGFSIYGGNSVVGSDAGWWIPLLAHRQNTLPPQYALVNEVPDPADYSRQVVELVTTIEEKSISDPQSISMLCDLGVTHIYQGQRKGRVGTNAKQLFSPSDLRAEKTLFNRIYQRDQVQIFELTPQACPNR